MHTITAIFIILVIQMIGCLAKPVENTMEFTDDQFNGNFDVVHNEHSKGCDEILGTGSGTSKMEKAIMNFLDDGHMHELNVLLNKLVAAKCYSPSTVTRFRAELADIHEFLSINKDDFEMLDNFPFKLNSQNKNKRIPSKEYFEELNDMVTSLIQSTDLNDPESIELLRYMIEHILQLEKDGDLLKPQAIKLLSRINHKLVEVEKA